MRAALMRASSSPTAGNIRAPDVVLPVSCQGKYFAAVIERVASKPAPFED